MAVKQIWLPIEDYLRVHRCEGTEMVYKYKIFVAVTEHFIEICNLYRLSRFVQFQKSLAWTKKNKYVCQKEKMSGHRWERINMVDKYIIHIDIIAELKAYLFVLKYMLYRLFDVKIFFRTCQNKRLYLYRR